MTTTYKNHEKLQNFLHIDNPFDRKYGFTEYWEVVKEKKEMHKILIEFMTNRGRYISSSLFKFSLEENMFDKLVQEDFFQLCTIENYQFVSIENDSSCNFDTRRLIKNVSLLTIGESFYIHGTPEYYGTDKDLEDAITLVSSDHYKIPKYKIEKIDNNLFSIISDGYAFFSKSIFSDYGIYGVHYM